jgi:hypothetical protein
MYKPCEREICTVNPCGDDCDYISANTMLVVSQYIRVRAEMRARGEYVPPLVYRDMLDEGDCDD